VQGGGQAAALHGGNAASGLDEVELAVELDAAIDTDAAIEIEEVVAAAEQDVLAIVDGCAGVFGGIERIGRGAPTEERTRFKQCYGVAGRAQGNGSGKTGQTSADNRNARILRQDARVRTFRSCSPSGGARNRVRDSESIPDETVRLLSADCGGGFP